MQADTESWMLAHPTGEAVQPPEHLQERGVMRVLKPGGEKPFGTLGTRAPVSKGQEGGGPERLGQVSSRGAGATGTEGNGNPPEGDCKGREERPCPSWKLLVLEDQGSHIYIQR